MIDFNCPNCGRKMRAPESLAGRRGKCPACGNVAVIPAAVVEPVEDTPPQQPEQILWSGHPTYWVFVPLFIVAVIGLLCPFVVPSIVESVASSSEAAEEVAPLVTVLSIAGIAIGVLLPVYVVLLRLTTRFEVTSRTVALRKGILTRSITEIPVDGIREVQVRQEILGRILNYGTVGFSSAASSDVEIVYRGASRPMWLKQLVKDVNAKRRHP